MQHTTPYAIIAIKEPVLQTPANDSLPAFVTYLVSGVDPHGEFNIRRRFREFLALRNKLVERFIGIYIPPLPSKRASGNTQESYVEERRKFLHYFCLKIAKRPYLFDSDIFQTFIRGDPDFERAARVISGRQYALIANIYDVEFRKEMEQSDMLQVVTNIEAEGEALKIVERTLVSLRNQMQEAVEARRQLLNEFRQCYRDILPKFEQQIVKKHDSQQQFQFFTNNHSFNQKMTAYMHLNETNVLKDFIQTLNYDIRQARAFLQAIQTRRYFMDKKVNFQSARRQSKQELQKLKSGRMTLRSVFSIGGKDNLIKDLQSHIPQFQRNEVFLEMCLPLSAIAIQRDLTEYKKNRSIIYLFNMQIIVQKEMRLVNSYGDILKTALVYSDLHLKEANRKRAETRAKLEEARERERIEDPTVQVQEIEVQQVAKRPAKGVEQQEQQDVEQARDHVDELQ